MKEHIELNDTELVSFKAGQAKTWLFECAYGEDIKESDSTRARFRYPPVIEMICNHISYDIGTSPSQIFLAGVLYDNEYCGSLVTKRLAKVREKARISNNACLRESVLSGVSKYPLYSGKSKRFRLKRTDIEKLSTEARLANLSIADLGLLRFQCWYHDMSGVDSELINLDKFKEFKRAKQLFNDTFEDLKDYTEDMEKRV